MASTRNPNWTRRELLVALRLYLTEPYGKLHARNPRIKALAKALRTRTVGAVAIKPQNFASLDPTFRETGRVGRQNTSHADRALWAEFQASPDAVLAEMDAVYESLLPTERAPEGSSEGTRMMKFRRHQRFFRQQVFSTYDGRCAVTGLDVPELLVASHIIPWAEDSSRRTDPTNGLLLNALFDRAFDVGLITFDESRRVVCSKALKTRAAKKSRLILRYEGARLRAPWRAPADDDALRWHRENCFDR